MHTKFGILILSVEQLTWFLSGYHLRSQATIYLNSAGLDLSMTFCYIPISDTSVCETFCRLIFLFCLKSNRSNVLPSFVHNGSFQSLAFNKVKLQNKFVNHWLIISSFQLSQKNHLPWLSRQKLEIWKATYSDGKKM